MSNKINIIKQLRDQNDLKVYPKVLVEGIVDNNGVSFLELTNVYTAGEGIEINNNEISVTYGFADRIKY